MNNIGGGFGSGVDEPQPGDGGPMKDAATSGKGPGGAIEGVAPEGAFGEAATGGKGPVADVE